MNKTWTAALAVVSIAQAPLALSQTVNWRVVAAESSAIVSPDLPANISRDFTDVFLGDVGAGQVGFRIASPDASDGYWARNAQGTLKRYMQPNVTGPLGPGRSGAESQDVFRDYNTAWGTASADGQRYFFGRAGGASAPAADLSYGLWRWDKTHNIELFRSLTDGPLGPNLGVGAVFQSSSSFVSGFLQTNGGAALARASITTQSGGSATAYIKNTPGSGNDACMVVGSTDPQYSPGLGSGSFSSSPWVLSTTPAGKFYGRFGTSTSREGIWELCNGSSPPQAIVLDEDTGPLGPDLGISTAYFTEFFGSPMPGAAGTLFFVASARENSSSPSFGGVYIHDAVSNRPLALKGNTADYSPHWPQVPQAVFSSFYYDTLSTSGDYASFEADLTTSDSSPHGLWRVRANGSPELVALIGITGDYGPEPSRTWRDFSDSAILANGDIVLEATTDPGNERALWLLKGHVARRIFQTGQSVTVQTATGAGQTMVSGWSLPQETGGGAQYSRGEDSWIGADGTILISASLVDYSGTTLLMAQPSNPIDLIFKNGFEQ